MKPINQSIVLFDGECVLCNSTVNFIAAQDKKKNFVFAALQSKIGQELLAKNNIKTDKPDKINAAGSIVLIEGGRVFLRSHAVLKIVTKLRAPWPIFGVFYIVPEPIRDYFYNIIARNRKKWFGSTDSCKISNSEYKDRFL